jgi:hypothetical protein
LAGTAIVAGAQTRLSGEITDKANMPVPDVLIYFGAGFLQTVSDVNGKFSFTYPDTLKMRIIRFESLGYRQKEMIVNRGQEFLRVILTDSLFRLQDVVVSRPKYGRFSDYSAQTVQMSNFDIITNPAAMADMLAGMRGIVPGVQTNDNDGRLIVQGGNSDESQIYINDLIVANPYSLSAVDTKARSRFTPDLFDGIVLQSGGYNAEFGQALSGIVNLNTLEREKIEPKTDISLSSVYAGVTHIDQKPSYAYRASLNYSNIGPYSRLTPRSYEWKDYYHQWSGDFFLTRAFGLRTKMTAQANWSKAGMEYTYYNVDALPVDDALQQDYFYAQVNLYHTFDPKWSLSLASNIVAEKSVAAEILSGIRRDDEKKSVWNHSKLNLQYAGGRFTNRSGIEFIYNPFRETFTSDRAFTLRMNNRLASIYNDTKCFLTNNLTANIGLRGEYSLYLHRFNLAPRLYLGYAPRSGNILSLSLGRYFQTPWTEYMKWEDKMDFALADKVTFSYGHVKKSDKYQVDIYYKKYNHLLTWQEGEYGPTAFAVQGTGYAWGADVFWKSNFKSLEYWLTYSFNHTRKRYGHFSQQTVPDYVAPHAFNVTLKYWFSPLKSLLSSGYNITSGTPYYSAQTPYEQMGTTPFRNRLDFSWSYLPVRWIIVHFGCQNIFGYKNIYGYRHSTLHPGVQQAIANPDRRFFFLGIFVTFSRDKEKNQLKAL